MAQEQRNDHDINVSLEQTHGRGMAEGMRADRLVLERGTMLSRLLDGLTQTFFHSPAGEGLAEAVLKDECGGFVWALVLGTFQCLGDGFEQRNDSFFSFMESFP
jgi:hypothetical protein